MCNTHTHTDFTSEKVVVIYGEYGHCVGDYLMGSAQDPACLDPPSCQSGIVAGRHPAICRLVAIVIVAIIIKI